MKVILVVAQRSAMWMPCVCVCLRVFAKESISTCRSLSYRHWWLLVNSGTKFAVNTVSMFEIFCPFLSISTDSTHRIGQNIYLLYMYNQAEWLGSRCHCHRRQQRWRLWWCDNDKHLYTSEPYGIESKIKRDTISTKIKEHQQQTATVPVKLSANHEIDMGFFFAILNCNGDSRLCKQSTCNLCKCLKNWLVTSSCLAKVHVILCVCVMCMRAVSYERSIHRVNGEW